MRFKNATLLQKYILSLIILLFLFSSCKTLDTRNPGPAPHVPETRSSVTIASPIPVATLDRLIESHLPTALVKEENVNFGNGLRGNLELNRVGNVTWTTVNEELLELQVPLHIRGMIGLSNRGLGRFIKGKIPLDEHFSPIIRVNPELDENWSLTLQDFELVDMGGTLMLNALGMNIDLSDFLRQQINQWASQNLGPDQEFMALKPAITQLWDQVGKPFALNWDTHELGFSIQPEEVHFEEFFQDDQTLMLRLGMEGNIQRHPAAALPSRAFPLPHLGSNPSEHTNFSIRLPIGIPYKTLDQELERYLGSNPLPLDRNTRMTLQNFQTGAFGELIKITADFQAERSNKNDLEGVLILVGKPVFDPSTAHILIRDVNFSLQSNRTQANWAVALKKKKLIRKIEEKATFPIGMLLENTRKVVLEQLQLQTPLADLRIQDMDLKPSGFYPLLKELEIHVQGEGKLAIDWN